MEFKISDEKKEKIKKWLTNRVSRCKLRTG